MSADDFFNGHDHKPSTNPLHTCTCEERGYEAAMLVMSHPPATIPKGHVPMVMVSERFLGFPADTPLGPRWYQSINWFLVALVVLALVAFFLGTLLWKSL